MTTFDGRSLFRGRTLAALLEGSRSPASAAPASSKRRRVQSQPMVSSARVRPRSGLVPAPGLGKNSGTSSARKLAPNGIPVMHSRRPTGGSSAIPACVRHMCRLLL